MEEDEYIVSNAVFSAVYNFDDKCFIKGRANYQQWRNFYAGSSGPPKVTRELLPPSKKALKIRVKHKLEPGAAESCKVESTLTILRQEITDNATSFKFTNLKASAAHLCTCSASAARGKS